MYIYRYRYRYIYIYIVYIDIDIDMNKKNRIYSNYKYLSSFQKLCYGTK